MSLRKPLLTLLWILSVEVAMGQTGRMAHWYFGTKAGVDFSSGSAAADPNGQLISIEGSSTMSDLSGNFLFSSNGVQVWDKNNQLMPNGAGLYGDPSSTQSALIVPMPGSTNLYYLFASIGGSGAGPHGLYYSIIDMNLHGGAGDVTPTQNVQLFSDGTEQLAGTKHCNGTDYWIMGRKSDQGLLSFYAYHLSGKGLSGPVVSTFTVPANQSWNTVGTLTFSTDGKSMAMSSFGTNTYIFSFNTQTGVLAMRDSIQSKPTEMTYSNAFSPDATKLYTSSWTGQAGNAWAYVAQFDLTSTDITASRVDLDSITMANGSPNGYGWFGQMRLAPDQKIYVSRWNQDHPYQVDPETFYSLDSLDAIQTPNQPGLSCGFKRDVLYLMNRTTMLGLPGFISNFTSVTGATASCPLLPPPKIASTGQCDSMALTFTCKACYAFDSVKWDFGDPRSGSLDTSYEENVTHSFPQTGVYTITLVGYYSGGSDTAWDWVRAGPIRINQGKDTLLCDQEQMSLTLNVPGADGFAWQDGSKDSVYVISKPGLYWVQVHDTTGCEGADSITVSYLSTPQVSLASNRSLCPGEGFDLKPLLGESGTYKYLWQDGSTDSVYKVADPGFYRVTVSNTCGSGSDSVNIKSGICSVYLPSAFTPNGDGHNDVFRPLYGSTLTQYNMEVFDRWGQPVFASSSPESGWDGRFGGKLQPAGTYVWSVRYETSDGKVHLLRGTVELVR